ncbi:MAG: GCN5-related N-acetyltransferase [Candidatus Gottesmanbacteria bacterium GW2011_GWC2_39_8]|uniref:GCN5-related N-acetyltransferase n=1 Tax=Candidatus Gottesmanbacteria bacterium GW2011_GWC2_39_8 TaxID=1618450 RepID=A0A0G0T1C8_9BACT|nr:MAG: GCN5-related N-acetyltransferase [Candidatus Gottesmanbacteria bacterium GW2011_GWC2_39_8]
MIINIMTNSEKTIFEGISNKGTKYIIRYPIIEDLTEMHRFINEISREKTYVRFQGEEITLEEEKDFLTGELTKIEKRLSVQLAVFIGNKLIGVSGIDMQDKTSKHVGVFGIMLGKEYRNEGIGKILMQKVLEEAEKEIPTLKIITLSCHGDNVKAETMYEKFGFKVYGNLPGGIVRGAKYVDHIYMYKIIASI